MLSLGGYGLSAVIDLHFQTHKADGTPATLSGTPAVSVYKTNSLTQSTTGVTLDVNFDGVTGLNHVRIDTSSDGTFYAAACDFSIVITTGTVDAISVVGAVVARFTINHNTVASVSGAVASVTGNVGGNVAGSVASVTGAVGSVTGLTASDVAGIKLQTDKFVFTVANQVNCNVQYVNDVLITGTGTTLDPWGP